MIENTSKDISKVFFENSPPSPRRAAPRLGALPCVRGMRCTCAPSAPLAGWSRALSPAAAAPCSSFLPPCRLQRPGAEVPGPPDGCQVGQQRHPAGEGPKPGWPGSSVHALLVHWSPFAPAAAAALLPACCLGCPCCHAAAGRSPLAKRHGAGPSLPGGDSRDSWLCSLASLEAPFPRTPCAAHSASKACQIWVPLCCRAAAAGV